MKSSTQLIFEILAFCFPDEEISLRKEESIKQLSILIYRAIVVAEASGRLLPGAMNDLICELDAYKSSNSVL